MMAALQQTPASPSHDLANPLAHLLTRLLRSGHIGGNPGPESRFPDQFWGIALASAIKCSEDAPQKGHAMTWSDAYTQIWQNLLGGLASQDAQTLMTALLAGMDQVARRQQVADLVSASEQEHPATSGRAFLSARAAKMVQTQACLLALFVGHRARSKRSDDGSDDSSDEEEEDSLSTIVERIILDDRRYFAPSTARMYAKYLASQPPSSLREALYAVVDRWGDVHRVKRATFEQEQCECPRRVPDSEPEQD